MSVLSINAGSSSIRFAFHGAGTPPARLQEGNLERIGRGGTNLSLSGPACAADAPRLAVDSADWHSAIAFLLGWLEAQPLFAEVRAVGHRVVHGMSHTSPQRVSEALLSELKADRALRPGASAAGNRAHRGHRPRAFPGWRRWRASTRPFTAACRAWRRYCRYRGAISRAACSATDSTASRTPFCCRSSRAGAMRRRRAAGSYSRISAAARALPPCATAKASTPAWVLRRLPDCP